MSSSDIPSRSAGDETSTLKAARVLSSVMQSPEVGWPNQSWSCSSVSLLFGWWTQDEYVDAISMVILSLIVGTMLIFVSAKSE